MTASRLRSCFRCAFGFAYAVIFAELFLRNFAPVAVFPRYVTAAPFGIRVNEPNRHYWHTSPDVSLEIRTNSRGVRSDEEISYEAAPGIQRIVVLGDSFAMGYEATLEKMFTSHMVRVLNSSGHSVQAVNLAVSGHSNAEELIMFQEEGKKYQPDLVLLCWHSSDLSENIRSGLFNLENHRLVRANPTYLPGVAIQRRLYQIPGYEWISVHSQAYCWIRETVAQKIAKPALLLWQKIRHPKAPATAESDEASNYPNELTLSLLSEIASEVHKSGGKFMILDIPSPRSNGKIGSDFPVGKIEGAADLMVVSPIHELEKLDGDDIFHKRSHKHFTPRACEVVGEVLAKSIIDNGLLNRTK